MSKVGLYDIRHSAAIFAYLFIGTVLGSVRRTEANESENYYVQFAELQKYWEITNVSLPIILGSVRHCQAYNWQETRLETRLVRKIIIWNQMIID